VEIVDIDERLAVGIGSGLDGGKVFVGKPVRTVGRGAQLALPVVESLKSVVHWAKDYEIGKLVLQSLGEGDGVCDVDVR
jgi:hypothetical protein